MDVRPKLLFLMALAVFTAASFSESASATLASELVVSPQIVVPNQRVSITGRGFTSSDVPGGSGPSGSHQISGIGESVITVGGTVLDTPHAFYPRRGRRLDVFHIDTGHRCDGVGRRHRHNSGG